MRKILVTGGAGYVGSHACLALAAAGYEPIVYDNLARGHRGAVQWGPFEHGDLLDRDRIEAVIRRYRPEAVMHFATVAYVPESVSNPALYYETNVAGTLTLLQACRKNEVPKFVLSSTCATYGIPSSVPISENSPQNPISPYGRSKLVVEHMLSDFGEAYQLQWFALRYFNAAGADADCRIGEQHHPETHLIPLVLQAASGERNNVTVFGTDYETPDGTCIRDYVHVSDLADAHVKALAALDAGQGSQALNLGSDKGASVREVIEAVQKATDRTLSIVEGERRQGDPPILICNSTRARALLNWTPFRSGLDNIVSTAWAWHQRLGSGS